MASGTCVEAATHFDVFFINGSDDGLPRVGTKEVADHTRMGSGEDRVDIITYKYKIYCHRSEQVGSVLARAYDAMWNENRPTMGCLDPNSTITCIKMDSQVKYVEHAANKFQPVQADGFNHFLGDAIGNVVTHPEQTNRLTIHQNTKMCFGPCVLCWGCICCAGWDMAPMSFMKRAPPGTTVEAVISSQPLKQPAMAPPPSFQAATGEDVASKLAQLGALRQQGVLTEEEFEAKKAPLIARL
eukprot:m.19482 g.19482  ORF g.19482 m.19482 type:complete len:242 (-) comp12481_c1_seq1:171-896(-)